MPAGLLKRNADTALECRCPQRDVVHARAFEQKLSSWFEQPASSVIDSMIRNVFLEIDIRCRLRNLRSLTMMAAWQRHVPSCTQLRYDEQAVRSEVWLLRIPARPRRDHLFSGRKATPVGAMDCGGCTTGPSMLCD